MKINVCTHPLIQHKLSYLRQHHEFVHFRIYESLLRELGMLLGYEASGAHLYTVPFDLEERAARYRPSDPSITWREGSQIAIRPVIIPIVRSGLIMAHAMREIIPTAYMGHIGLINDDQGTPQTFMVMVPERVLGRKFFIVDLFVDRGKSAEKAIRILLDIGIPADDIVFISLIMSKEGIEYLEKIKALEGTNFLCARVDGMDETGDWMPDYQDTNYRLFRTRSHVTYSE